MTGHTITSRNSPTLFNYSQRHDCLSRCGLEKTTALLATHSLSLLLHNLANLHGRIEELCGAAVEADGFALVELAFAVVGGDALLLARLLEAAVVG